MIALAAWKVVVLVAGGVVAAAAVVTLAAIAFAIHVSRKGRWP